MKAQCLNWVLGQFESKLYHWSFLLKIILMIKNEIVMPKPQQNIRGTTGNPKNSVLLAWGLTAKTTHLLLGDNNLLFTMSLENEDDFTETST